MKKIIFGLIFPCLVLATETNNGNRIGPLKCSQLLNAMQTARMNPSQLYGAAELADIFKRISENLEPNSEFKSIKEFNKGIAWRINFYPEALKLINLYLQQMENLFALDLKAQKARYKKDELLFNFLLTFVATRALGSEISLEEQERFERLSKVLQNPALLEQTTQFFGEKKRMGQSIYNQIDVLNRLIDDFSE